MAFARAKGLNIFRDRFRQFEGSFTLIGGPACDEWFTAQGPYFHLMFGARLTRIPHGSGRYCRWRR
jgi:hypothetical protein